MESPGCLSLRRRGRSRLGSLLEASRGGAFSEGEGAARSPGHRAGGGTGSGTQLRCLSKGGRVTIMIIIISSSSSSSSNSSSSSSKNNDGGGGGAEVVVMMMMI